VTVTVKPDKGYEVGTVTVTDSNGGTVQVKDNGDGTYTFTQPKGRVTVKAAFQAVQAPQPVQPSQTASCPKDGSCPIGYYSDISSTGWYHDGIHYCIENNLMGGYTDMTFKPDNPLTRAQLAQILYNREGRPAVTARSPYTDVPNDAWCKDAVVWSIKADVIGGYGDGRFGPDDPVTRQQLAVILWRYTQAKGQGVPVGNVANVYDFKDVSRISEYASPAFQWAVGAGVVGGRLDGTLDPQGRATRAQAASMLQRYLENVMK